MNRKRLHLLLPALLALVLISCQVTPKKQGDKIVFASILPLQYFTDRITGGLYHSEVMVPPGVGPETYNPTPRQMSGMSEARAFFANGFLGFEEAYAGKFQSINPNLVFINTSAGVELIQAEGHSHGDHVHEKGVDPHTWSTPEGARIIARNILEGMVKVDPENKALFEANYNRLIATIDSVDRAVQSILANIPSRKFMVFHPALGYYARQYQLEQLSIEFEGKVPTPKHVQGIIEEAREHKIAYIMIQKEFDVENADIIARETGSRVIQIDPLSYDWPGEMVSLARKMAGIR
jgi:zinc transport system substrate-binding protein